MPDRVYRVCETIDRFCELLFECVFWLIVFGAIAVVAVGDVRAEDAPYHCQPDSSLGPTLELTWTHDEADIPNVDVWIVQYWSHTRDEWMTMGAAGAELDPDKYDNARGYLPSCLGVVDGVERGVDCRDSSVWRRVDPGIDWPLAIRGSFLGETAPKVSGSPVSHQWYNFRVCAENESGYTCGDPIGVCWPLWLQEIP